MDPDHPVMDTENTTEVRTASPCTNLMVLAHCFLYACKCVLIIHVLLYCIAGVGLLPLFFVDPVNAPTCLVVVVVVFELAMACMTAVFATMLYNDNDFTKDLYNPSPEATGEIKAPRDHWLFVL